MNDKRSTKFLTVFDSYNMDKELDFLHDFTNFDGKNIFKFQFCEFILSNKKDFYAIKVYNENNSNTLFKKLFKIDKPYLNFNYDA